MPASSHVTHLNTARNSQTKKPSVTLSAAMRILPSLFIDVIPICMSAAASVSIMFGQNRGRIDLNTREPPPSTPIMSGQNVRRVD